MGAVDGCGINLSVGEFHRGPLWVSNFHDAFGALHVPLSLMTGASKFAMGL